MACCDCLSWTVRIFDPVNNLGVTNFVLANVLLEELAGEVISHSSQAGPAVSFVEVEGATLGESGFIECVKV
jgi:hypothetical protein